MSDSNSTGEQAPLPTEGVPEAVGNPGQRHFFTGPFIKTELLVEWMGQHGISAESRWVDPTLPDDGDLGREAHVFVMESDYTRAHQLFYAEREDEL